MKLKKMLAFLTCICMTVPAFANFSVNAEKESVRLLGDVNTDSKCSVADLVMMNRYILGAGSLKSYDNADMNEDGYVDIFDMNLLRSSFIQKDASFEVPDISVLKNLTEDYEKEEVTAKEADEKFILGQTDFALSLLQKVVKEDGNVLISPYSVMEALAMTANGADGQTKSEMEDVLGGITIEELNEYLYTQRERMIGGDDSQVKVANSVWTINNPERIVVYPEYLQKVVNYYNSEIFRAPFNDDTLKDVNQWVSDNTDGMIPKILDQISEHDVMYLINTVLFDAEWNENYKQSSINNNGKFTAYDGTEQNAVMMYSEEGKYIKDENARGFIKDYKGNKYSFAAILPDEGVSVDEYVKSLTPERLNSILSDFSYKTVITEIPKFSFDYGGDIVEILKKMGMPTACGYFADFSKMARTKTESLFIGSVIHKTKIEVTEYGTKAAGATIVKMKDDVASIERPEEIIFNRPFVFAIIDNETSLPVFIGTLTSMPETD